MMRKKSLLQQIGTCCIVACLSILALSFIYPILFMAMNGFKGKMEYKVSPFALPKMLDFTNYELLIVNFHILNNIKNTMIIAVVSVIISLIIGVFASYAFAKLKFKGKTVVYMLILSTMFIPAQVTMVPMYYLFSSFNLVNTLTAVIISYVANTLPSTILLLTTSFIGINNEMIEAAKLDGAGYFHIISNVIVPMGISVIAINIIFNFLYACNDLFTPLILLQASEKKTVMVSLASLMSNRAGDPPYQLAGLMMSALPALLVYLLFSKFIVKGLTVGSVK